MLRALTSPRMLGLHVVALVATTAAVWLGFWQYGAWQEHRADQVQALAHAAPKALPSVMGPDEPFPGEAVGQPVHFSGSWLPESTFYVAHRTLEGRSGFWAVTPVEVCGGGCHGRPAMLVVRGWAPRPAEMPPPPRGRAAVSGWLQPPEGAGVPDARPGDDVLPELRIADAIQRVNQDLYGAYVISRASDGNLTPVTPASLPKPDTFTSVRNIFYALEWWVFGAFAVFIWWRWCADELAAARARRAPEPEDPDRRTPSEEAGEPGGGSGPGGGSEASTAEVASSP